MIANLQVWVITGDKQETAINIAIACKLIRNPGSLLICNEKSAESAAKRLDALGQHLQRQYEPVYQNNPIPHAGMSACLLIMQTRLFDTMVNANL